MELKTNQKGKIFDIQGFSVHDGPGSRSLIFLKGCSLNCFWCSNPEGISFTNVPLYYSVKCIGCANCAEHCSKGAISHDEGKPVINRAICRDCNDFGCVSHCYTEALRICGRDITVEELFGIIQRDRQYWGNKGGITLTGGEPLMQAGFATAILKKCFDSYIHTTIETCGNIPWKNFEGAISYIEWIFFDVKHIDPAQHKFGTGCDNSLIINNIKNLNNTFKGRLVFRLPFIPGFNDSKENIEGIARLIADTRWKEINILPLHHLGREKYNSIDSEYRGTGYHIPSAHELSMAAAIFEKHGIKCHLGNDTQF